MLLVIITHLSVVSSRQRLMNGKDAKYYILYDGIR